MWLASCNKKSCIRYLSIVKKIVSIDKAKDNKQI